MLFRSDATASAALFNGIPSVSVSASNLDLALNRPANDGTLINFAAAPITVKTGPSSTRSLDLSGANGPLLEATGNLTVDVAGFFRVSGSLGFKKSDFDLKLSDGTTKSVQMLTVAGEDLSAFAGMKASSPDKAGLNLTGVDFALAVASDKDDTTRRWTTLQANADSIALTGITGVTMASSDLAVTINRAANDGTIADYSSTPLTLNTEIGRAHV